MVARTASRIRRWGPAVLFSSAMVAVIVSQIVRLADKNADGRLDVVPMIAGIAIGGVIVAAVIAFVIVKNDVRSTRLEERYPGAVQVQLTTSAGFVAAVTDLGGSASASAGGTIVAVDRSLRIYVNAHDAPKLILPFGVITGIFIGEDKVGMYWHPAIELDIQTPEGAVVLPVVPNPPKLRLRAANLAEVEAVGDRLRGVVWEDKPATTARD